MQDTQPVQVSTNYNNFSFLITNREQTRGHVEALKKAFAEMGNLTRVQPILVNENLQIIDGQHRFLACKELGEPIYYTQVEGLGIHDARQMNILHRSWTAEDYARSYAAAGDANYIRYLQLKEEYQLPHSIMLIYTTPSGDDSGMFKNFRNGDFTFDNREEAIVRLDLLASAGEVVPMIRDRAFARAFLRVIKTPGYEHKRMLRKLGLHQDLLKRYSSVEDYLRMLEDIYNHQMSENNRLRLY